jgi:hypothetical protein
MSSVTDILKSLRSEGYATDQVQGPTLKRQLNVLVRVARLNDPNAQREGIKMDWIVTSRDNGLESDVTYTTEQSFIASLQDLLRPASEKKFVSAMLPTGKVLEETAARVIIGQPG